MKNTIQLDIEEYRLLQQSQTEAQTLKEIDGYINSLFLTDAQCAKLLDMLEHSSSLDLSSISTTQPQSSGYRRRKYQPSTQPY